MRSGYLPGFLPDPQRLSSVIQESHLELSSQIFDLLREPKDQEGIIRGTTPIDDAERNNLRWRK